MLQIYVWLSDPGKFGKTGLLSIGVSALTTGFTSSMITFEVDVLPDLRKLQSKFAGFIPDDNTLRGRCFMTMMMMSAIHNLSRSAGYAMLATQDPMLVVLFIVGEMVVYFVWKLARRDFLYWVPIEGAGGLVASLLVRCVGKIIVDFTGCIQFRHPNELGGAAFAASVLWAQVFPIVALQLYEGDEKIKRSATIFFIGSFMVWIVLAMNLCCIINLSLLNTFYSTQTASQFVIKRFTESGDDQIKFDAIFSNRLSFTKPIYSEVKAWVADNIDRWKLDKPEWFKINEIPPEMMPS